MNKIDKLISDFSSKGIKKKSYFIIYNNFCSEFIDSCKKNNIAILGIDGFFLFESGEREPNIDEIADFSEISNEEWSYFFKKSITASESFISYMLEEGTSDGYEFTLVSDE